MSSYGELPALSRFGLPLGLYEFFGLLYPQNEESWVASISNSLTAFHDKRKEFNMMKSCSCGVERDSEASKLKFGVLALHGSR